MDEVGNLLLPEEWGAHRSLNDLIADEWKLRVLVKKMRDQLDTIATNNEQLAAKVDHATRHIALENVDDARALISEAAEILGAPHD